MTLSGEKYLTAIASLLFTLRKLVR